MDTAKTAAERYWIIYYLVYLAVSGAGLWYYWPRLLWYWRQPVMENDSVDLLAAIFGAAVGTALGVAILLEVGGRMVLLIPAAVKKLKAEGRQEERQRIRAAVAELVVQKGGSEQAMISKEEILKILQGEGESRS